MIEETYFVTNGRFYFGRDDSGLSFRRDRQHATVLTSLSEARTMAATGNLGVVIERTPESRRRWFKPIAADQTEP